MAARHERRVAEAGPEVGARAPVPGGALGRALGSLDVLGRILTSPLHLPGMGRRDAAAAHHPPGAAPGIEHLPDLHTPPPPEQVAIRCIDYGPDRVEFRAVTDVDSFLAAERPPWSRVRWINIDGLHPYVVNRFRQAYGFHTLAAEDVLHVPQRPRMEPYDDHLFLVARMLMLEHGHLVSEQLTLFLYADAVLTFQEERGDVWEPIRERIRMAGSRVRAADASYLAYALFDAVVDHCFPILEQYGDLLEKLENMVTARPDRNPLPRIHAVKRELAMLRRVMWPMREVLDRIHRDEHPQVTAGTRTYLRDVYEHTVQIIDIVETYREMAAGLTELHMSAVSNRMNEVMKVLTIMASLFIPITFLAGVYGMNFEHMPELKHPHGYAFFWVLCVAVTIGLLVYFRRKGWLGGR